MLNPKTGSLEIMCDWCDSSLLETTHFSSSQNGSTRELGMIMVEVFERQLINHLQLTGWDNFSLPLCATGIVAGTY